jgi:lipopolysaccharide assembly outer membrane protein LptD (OstA)
VLTPYRDQSLLPNFDTAASDFNSMSIYQDNEFTGVDRVSDEHQVTLGRPPASSTTSRASSACASARRSASSSATSG